MRSSSPLNSDSWDDAAEPAPVWLPDDLVGGTVPHIPGEEEAMVWQAAHIACNDERLRIVWSVENGVVWWLAAPAAGFNTAGRADSRCPFAALLPGMALAPPPPAVYLHVLEDKAALMVVEAGSLRIQHNSPSVMRATARRVAASLAVEVLEINDAAAIAELPPWRSVELADTGARRGVTELALRTGLAAAALSVAVWLAGVVVLWTTKADLSNARQLSADAGRALVLEAQSLSKSPLGAALADLTALDARIAAVGGVTRKYELKDERLGWTAEVPRNVAIDRRYTELLGAQVVGLTRDETMLVIRRNP